VKQYRPIKNLSHLIRAERMTIAEIARAYSRSHGAVVAQMIREGLRGKKEADNAR